MFETIGAPQRSRYVLFSTTKALTAGAVWLLMGDGLLDVERPVAEYIPEFATNGKGAVTVEQVLLHSSGFPRAPLGPPEWFDRSSRLEAFAQWRLNWDPGTQVEYHATSAHWVLAELIERLSGTDYRHFVRDRISQPLGLDGLELGVPLDQQGDVRRVEHVGDPPDPEELAPFVGGSAISRRSTSARSPMRPSCGSTSPRCSPSASPGPGLWAAQPTSLYAGPAPQPRAVVGPRRPGRRHRPGAHHRSRRPARDPAPTAASDC